MSIRVVLMAAGLSLSLSCATQAFNCQDAGDCGSGGQCQPTGYCSFADTKCPSGQRYGDLAGAGLAGECVNPAADTDTDTAASTVTTAEASSTATSTTPSTGTVSSSGADDDSTSRGAATDTSTGGGSESSTGTPVELYAFFDDFNRADTEEIGNDWVEDNPAVFSIVGEEVAIDAPQPTSYPNNLVYRPLTESVADVEVTAVVRFDNDSQAGVPQIFGRVQSDVRGQEDVSAYLCFYSSSGNLVLRRNNLAEETGLASSAEPMPFNGTDDFRLRLRIQGADPVSLRCAFDVLMNDRWSELGNIIADDAEVDALVEPGVVAFSTHVGEQPYRYDDFSAVELPPY